MTSIYLDNCSLQRPYDNQAQVRIRLETEAILAVIALFEQGQIQLIASEALYAEAQRTPNIRRRMYVVNLLAEMPHVVKTTESMIQRAKHLATKGIKPFDALHVATALETSADYFCTCDDKLLKRTKSLDTGKMKAVSPLDLIAALAL